MEQEQLRKYIQRRSQRAAADSQYKQGDTFDMEGSFTATRFQNSDSGFVIGTFTPDNGDPIVCKGTIPGYVQGAPYHITGTVINDKQWGLQVNVKAAVSVKPTGKQSIISFLGSGAIPGIGPMTARRIYKTFGDDSLEILEDHPERLVEVQGIGEKSVKKMVDTIPKVLKYRDVIAFFTDFGISTTTINAMIREYGAKAAEAVKENPYILCKVKGFAFTRADQIAQKMHIDRYDHRRLEAGLVATLRYGCQRDGHTLMPRHMLLQLAYEKLGLDETRSDIVMKTLDKLVEDNKLIEDADGVHLKHLYAAEKTIKRSLKSAQRPDELVPASILERNVNAVLSDHGSQLTDEQERAVYAAFNSKLSILTGGAGCGKALLDDEPIWCIRDGEKTSTLATIGTLHIGDSVFGADGKPTKVVGVFPQGEQPKFKMSFTDGTSIICSDEHIWHVNTDERANNGDGYIDITVRELLDRVHGTEGMKVTDWFIPQPRELQFPASKTTDELAIADYLGIKNDIYAFANDDVIGEEHGESIGFPKKRSKKRRMAILDDTENVINQDDGTETNGENDGEARLDISSEDDAQTMTAVTDASRSEAKSTESHIAEYVNGTAEQRLAILNQLVGHMAVLESQGKRGTHVYNETRRGIQLICSSLCMRSGGGTTHIASIEDMGETASMTCIKVAAEDGLFVAGEQCIVTHNTTVTSTIVKTAERLGLKVCLMSPTGRAAKHLSDQCGGVPGYTMHRALSIVVKGASDEDFFADDEAKQSNRPPNDATLAFDKAKIVICDEASMMDTEMAAILFNACKKKHLVLVGDPNQLPSVGPGRVLGDIIDNKIGNVTKLTKIFRQKEGSPVIAAANACLAGQNPANELGVEFYEATNEQVQQAFIEHVVPSIEKEHLDQKTLMVISPIKRTPYSGVNDLNDFLRPIMNRNFKEPENPDDWYKLQKGDYVFQKKNNYDCDIYNGDVGVVDEAVYGKDGFVQVDFSIDEDPKPISFELGEVSENLMMAFASTVHKQQGSQADTVVVVMTMSHFPMLSRNLLYTAITRAERRVILIGERKAFAMAAKKELENKRMTGLRNYVIN